MAITEDEIRQIAEAREQEYILVSVRGSNSWLLTDKLPCSLDKLAQSLSTDEWEMYCDGKLKGYDKDGKRIHDAKTPRDWRKIQPVQFLERQP